MEQVFISNPKLDVAYKTADGKYFFLESDAENYALELEDKRVKKVQKEEEYLEATELQSNKEKELRQRKTELM